MAPGAPRGQRVTPAQNRRLGTNRRGSQVTWEVPNKEVLVPNAGDSKQRCPQVTRPSRNTHGWKGKTPQNERRAEGGCALTFILSIEASILNCWTVRRAWAMLLVVVAVLPDIFSEAGRFCFKRQRVILPGGGTAR